jgi:Fic-DOC domain mobile mystery protein B
MGLNLSYEYGQTPLEEEEMEGLKITSISTKSELDEFEQMNIEDALRWMLGKKWKAEKILTENFICNLHHQMYGKVWKWAGVFRTTAKNIGVPAFGISVALRQLLDDTRYWIEHSTFPPDETAIQFKHRLVSIHCFPNGNGRHSRLMADIIVEKIFQLPVFTWGGVSYHHSSEARKMYIEAVKAADKGDLNGLLGFARG